MTHPYLSIVIPIYNEASNIQPLFTRLQTILGQQHQSYEIIFINDGSQDTSEKLLNKLYNTHSQIIKVVHLAHNFGQHMAIIAGFEVSRGDIIITLDADLQNPPEEIPKLIQTIEQGYDYVGGIRSHRQDHWFRYYASKLNNYLRSKITRIVMTDQGSMLRAYTRNIIDRILSVNESNVFIPALAYHYASRPTEIPVDHHPRRMGQSKYNIYQLLRLNFDLMTGFSLVPLQLFTIVGMTISLLSTGLVVFLLLRRLLMGPEVGGVFTLFAILYFLIGVVLIGLGIIGEYVGRIHNEVRKRPRFIVRERLGVFDEHSTY